MSLGSELSKATGIKWYRVVDAIKPVRGPYYPFMTLDQFTEITVSDSRETDDMLVEVYVEKSKNWGFAVLRVEVPTMDIIECSGLTELEFRELMGTIASSLVEIDERSSRGWGNA